ncbi:MAG: hypothetical protein HGA56_10010, partial [Chlorobiaceae bacterium]|nr:hypothetical protein [Chlorobiaceae bacterium]
MSRSLIACAIDTGTTTIVRFKSAGQSAGIMTDCRTVRYGLEAMRGPKGAKTIGKLAAMLRKWDKEPVAISISPESIRTLPAWFPATASSELRDRLGRIEAGFFLKNVDEWSWDSMRLAPRMDHPKELEEQVIMFYPAEPARSIDEAPGLDRLIVAKALHFEPIVRLTSGTSEPMAVLELEKEYAAFFISRAGRADYFRYWPVKNENEREFFAIKELGSA